MAPIRGTRSSRDAVTWTCKKGYKNLPQKNLLFDLPAFNCGCGCGEKFEGDLEFCMGDIKINNHDVLGKPMDQGKGGHCVPFAYAKTLEITRRMKAIAKDIDPNSVTTMRASDLIEKYKRLLGEKKCTRSRKLLYMAKILREEGIRSEDRRVLYKVSDVSTVRRDDYEAIASNLAKGFPLHAGVNVGGKLKQLKFCQIYKPPLKRRFFEKRSCVRGHAVVLVGAGRKKGSWYFFFLNSWRQFCVRLGPGGKVLRFGIGKVMGNRLSRNVIRLSRFKEPGSTRSFELQGANVDSEKNYRLLMSLD